ncbi:hypothetical protein LPJ70_003235, partial [Coemansia sp. RSA 2708]
MADANSSARVALVTGCSAGGIGYHLALELAAHGCRVYASSRDASKVTGLAERGVEAIELDVTRDDSTEAAVAKILDEAGRIDILVNNAGVICVGPVTDTDLRQAQTAFDTNVLGVARVAKAVAPSMIKQQRGLIVNVGSVSGYAATPWVGFYGATKAAVHTMSDAMRTELAPFNIDVVVLAPGGIRSNLATHRQVELDETSPFMPAIQAIRDRAVFSQTGGATPTDQFAKVVVPRMLARNPAPYITMPAFVTIQALPARIIGNILRFLQYKQTAQSIRQLLQVCHQWRRVLFQLECSQYVVRVGTVIDKGYTLWPAELPQPDDHFFALVTTLNFTIDFNYIFNGKGVQKVSGIWCHQQIFPHVRHLNLLIQHNTSDEDILMHDYDSHAHVFAKFIKQLVPKAAALTVSYDAFTMVKEMPTDHSFNAMLTNLFRNMHYSAMLVNYNDFINSYQPEIAHSLSRLDCCWNERYEQVLPLIHNSSETLIELRLTCHGMSRDKLAHLFVSSYNHYIIYYNLEKLVFEKSANRDDAFKPSLQVCQFMPKLRYLYLGIVYPFADDLLFRGTMDTLEYLHLTPDVDMLQMLDKYQ